MKEFIITSMIIIVSGGGFLFLASVMKDTYDEVVELKDYAKKARDTVRRLEEINYYVKKNYSAIHDLGRKDDGQ